MKSLLFRIEMRQITEGSSIKEINQFHVRNVWYMIDDSSSESLGIYEFVKCFV